LASKKKKLTATSGFIKKLTADIFLKNINCPKNFTNRNKQLGFKEKKNRNKQLRKNTETICY